MNSWVRCGEAFGSVILSSSALYLAILCMRGVVTSESVLQLAQSGLTGAAAERERQPSETGVMLL